MTEAVQFISLILLLLVTGVFWGPWLALHRSMKLFSKDEFVKLVKILSANLALPMRIMMPACILVMIASVFLYPLKASLGFYMSIIAVALIIASLIVTIAVEVPIVKQIEKWTEETMPPNMEEIQDKWLRFHVVRIITAIISFACFIVSILFLHHSSWL